MPAKSAVPVLTAAFTARVPGSHVEYVEPVTGGDHVLTSSFDGVFRVDGATGALIETVFPPTRTVCWGARSVRAGRIVAAAFGTQQVFVRRDARAVGPFRTDGIAIRTSITDDGTLIAVQVANRQIIVLDGETLAARWQRHLTKSFANGACIDERGERFACAGTDGVLRFFDAQTGAPREEVQTQGWANDVDFRAERIAVGGRGKTVHVLDGSGRPLRSLVYGATIERVSLSHDGRRCAASGTKGAALVWDVDSGQPIARIDAGDGVTSAVFSRAAEGPTGYRLVASLRGPYGKPAVGTWYVV